MKKFLLFKILFFSLLNISLQGQCNYTLKMDDSYGDGWNGNTIDVLVNGSVVLDDVTLSSGTTQSLPIPVNTGDAITTIWNGGGSYGAETSYEILDSSGNVVGSAAQSNIDTPINVNCPSCPVPIDLTATNITDSSADLSWTAGGSETSWNIEWGPTGYTQGSGTSVNGITNPYTLSGLTATTEYDYYVQADCTTDGTSDWAGPFTFLTTGPGVTCDNALNINSLPFTASDNTSNYGDDYSSTDACSSNYMNGDDVVYEYTPTQDECVNITLTNTGAWVGVFVIEGCPFTTCTANNTSSTGNPLLTNVSLTGGTTYYIVISTYPSPQSTAYDLEIVNCPACPVPTNLSASNITGMSAELSWTAGGSETSWNIEWGTSGFTQGSGTLLNGVTNPYTLSGLTSETEYQYYVQADCTADGTSDWAGPFTFTTLPPPPSNDECANAKPLDCTTNTSYTGETTVGSTDNGDAIGCTTLGNGIWYKFNGEGTITVTSQAGAGFDHEMAVATSTDCTSFTKIDCSDGAGTAGTETIEFVATAGIDYYIYVGHYSFNSTGTFDISVSCSTCIEPTFTVADGGNNCPTEEFFVDVDVTDLGGGSSVDVTDGTTTLTAQTTGTYTFGPYAASATVDFTVSDNADGNCSATESYTTNAGCPPANDFCSGAIPITPSAEGTGCGAAQFTLPFATDGTTDSGVPTVCLDPGNDQWFTWTATSLSLIFNSESPGDPGIAIFASCADANAGTEIACANTFVSDNELNGWDIGDDLLIQIYDFEGSSSDVAFCLEEKSCSAASFTVAPGNDNCPTEEFFLEVDVTDLGSASSVDITDGTTTLTAQTTGTYTFGPYSASTSVDFTVSDNADSNCSATESYTTNAGCPPTCGGKFYDSGGATGDYTNNENITTTICPDNSGDVVTVTFVSFDTEESYDFLNIYDGNDATGNNLGQFSGTSNPGPFTSTATDGCLTFVFTSDGSFTKAGWEADVTCTPACNAPDNISLAPSTMTLSPSNTCDESGMTYYGDGNGSYFFAINWGTANNDAKNAASVSITTGAMGSEEDTNASVPEATYTMGRYWNVDLNGQYLSEDVSVRFYYDAAEKTAVETMASDFVTANASEGTVAQDGKWFKTVGMDFDHTAINATEPGQGAIELSATEGMQDGVDYVEFTVSSFSGGTFATGAGVSGSSLPIELLSFNAREKGAVNMITWSTASEINTKEMMIQASPDGKAWKEIGKVESRGSERNGSEYEIVDNDPYFKTYYRIVTEDFDGSIERSRIVYVTRKDDSAGWKVSVAPNPTQRNSILNFDSYRSENIVVSVIDITGKLVSQTKYQADKGLNQYEIDLADQSSGLYIVKISSDSRSETLRVSKM